MSNDKRPILLVEDNPMDVDLTLESFKEHNLANPVLICRDGEEAVEFIEQHRQAHDPQLPLLVLLDLRLPKMDGLDVLQRARSDEVWKKIPIVVLTTSRDDKDIHRAYEIGANSYIVKPVDFEKFADVAGKIKVYWLLTNENAYPEKIIK
jgi:CheY-like chemotaxis protein